MEKKINSRIIKKFGPSILQVKIPDEIVKKLNNYVDKIIDDKNKSKELNAGENLVGDVTQEFMLEDKFIKDSGWYTFLASCVNNWIEFETKKKIKKFEIINSWIVRQFKNEYNPIHWHGGHISGAGYLKVPDTFGETFQPNKHNVNGRLELIHGNRAFMCSSKATITPKVGEMFFFPHYLMHAVSPFVGTDQERRSISFNCFIDEDIFNVFGRK